MAENFDAPVLPAYNKKDYAHLPLNTPVELGGVTQFVGPGGRLYPSRRRVDIPTLPEKPGPRTKPAEHLKGTLTSLLAQKVRDPELYGVMISDPEMLSMGVTREQVIAMQLVEKACQGDLGAIDRLYDRLYGKATQHVEEKKEVTVLSYSQFLLKIQAEDRDEITRLME